MSGVLTNKSTIACPSQGTVGLAASNKLTVNGSSVLLQADVALKTISGCGQATSNSTQQCLTVLSVTAGTAGKLTVGGQPVMLDTLAGTSDGKPLNTLSASSAGQSKLTAV